MSDAGNGVTRCDYCGSCCGCDADCPAPSNVLMDNEKKLAAMYRRFEADQGRIEELQAKALGVGTENARLRAALAPILAHADAGEVAPPIRFSVGECRRVKREVEG